MRKHGYLIAIALVSVAATSQARKKKSINEDPFAYEEREKEREHEREEAEEAEESKQAFGSSGDFAISVERLVGYAYTTTIIKETGPDTKTNVGRLHGFVSPAGDAVGFSSPRIGFDYFVSKGISLGGAFGYGQNMGDEDRKLVTLSPRFGYALMFGSVVGIWPRLGPTYQVMFADSANNWLLAGTFELPLTLVAAKNVAFTLGPRVDWAFLGKVDAGAGDPKDFKGREFGFSAGMTTFF